MPDTISPPLPAARIRVVRARHAASLIVLRDGREVLMGLRGAGHRFMPNRLVFPGGAVDPADSRAPVATKLRPEVRALLERSARPPLARALGHAAARELEEETGLRLGAAPGAPPALDGLDYVCRAVTPSGRPMRFNARFLLVDAARVSGTLAGSGELEDLRWYELDEVLKLDLLLVTRGVLEQLRRLLAMSPAERAARRVPVFLGQQWRVE